MSEDLPVLTVENLFHRFKKHEALKGMNFTVARQSIHGFVGPNGAGKTTTLKLIATLLKPQTGKVRVFSLDVDRDYKQVRRKIGFMPDHFSMYRQMTVFEYLDFFAAAYGLNQADRDAVIGDVLALTDMDGRQDDLIKGLSRGMQQRVSLARVLVHDPDLLLLDEPASGLDPRARIELMEILRELRRLGKTIFISSHILSELADLCDSVTIVDRGQVRYTGSMKGLLTQDSESEQAACHVLLVDDVDNFKAALLAVDGVQSVERADNGPEYKVVFDRSAAGPNAILTAAIFAGGQIAGFREDMKHLNQAFMDLTEGGVRSD